MNDDYDNAHDDREILARLTRENSSLKGGKKNDMKVSKVEGKRKADLSTFYGLKFEGEHHASFFLTPGQFRTVTLLQREAWEIVRKLPRLPQCSKRRLRWA